MTHFEFINACRQWNRENGYTVPQKSTESIVRKLQRKEVERLAGIGRRK